METGVPSKGLMSSGEFRKWGVTPDLVRSRVRAALRARDRIDKEVLAQRSFVRGDHWHNDYLAPRRDENQFVFRDIDRASEARAVFNHIEKGRIERVSTYAQLPPEWDVIPATNKSTDIEAAMSAQRCLEWWGESRQLRQLATEAYHYVSQDGTVFYHYGVDQGEDQLFLHPYHNVMIQPGTIHFSQADWLCTVHLLTVGAAKDMAAKYGGDASKIEPSRTTWLEENRIPLMGSGYGREAEQGLNEEDWGYTSEDEDKLSGKVVWFEFHDLRDGYVGAFTDQHFIGGYDSHLLFPPHLKRWFIKKEYAVPGQLYGKALLALGMDSQIFYNRIMNQLLDHAERYARPQVLVPEGSVEDPHDLDGESGTIIEVNPTMGWPSFLQGPEPMNALFQLPSMLQEQIQMLTFSGDARTGKVSKDTSGRALAVLEAQNESVLSLMADGFKSTFAEIGYTILNFQKYLYDDGGQPLIFKVLGDNKTYRTHEFMTANLQPGFTVKVNFGSILSVNRTLRANAVQEQFAAGLIIDPKTGQPDPERALRMMGDATPIRPYGQDTVERAREEFHILSQAQDMNHGIEVYEFEDHERMIEAHTDFLRRPQSYRLKQTNPAGYQMMLQHLQMHKQYQMMAQQQQLMASHQQIAGGASPQAGGSPAAQSMGSPPAGGPSSPVQEADARASALAREGGESSMNSGEQPRVS